MEYDIKLPTELLHKPQYIDTRKLRILSTLPVTATAPHQTRLPGKKIATVIPVKLQHHTPTQWPLNCWSTVHVSKIPSSTVEQQRSDDKVQHLKLSPPFASNFKTTLFGATVTRCLYDWLVEKYWMSCAKFANSANKKDAGCSSLHTMEATTCCKPSNTQFYFLWTLANFWLIKVKLPCAEGVPVLYGKWCGVYVCLPWLLLSVWVPALQESIYFLLLLYLS